MSESLSFYRLVASRCVDRPPFAYASLVHGHSGCICLLDLAEGAEDQGCLGRCLGESAQPLPFALQATQCWVPEMESPTACLFPAQPTGIAKDSVLFRGLRLEVLVACSRAKAPCRARVGGSHPMGCDIQHRPGATEAGRHSPWHPHPWGW